MLIKFLPFVRITDEIMPQLQILQGRLEAIARYETRQTHVLTDWCVRHLLTFWQSELEPELIYGPGWELKGLGHAGQVIIPLRWLAFVDFGDC
jgi:hypothetical protein